MADQAAETERLLAEVLSASERIKDARRELHAAVVRARRAGASYGAVGQVLGVSRQAAWERFRHPRDAESLKD